jgi:hypothetical protein
LRPRLIPFVAIVLAAAPGFACSGDKGPTGPPRPAPGILRVQLVTPNADDGALVVSLIGPGAISDVSAPAGTGYLVHSRGAGGQTMVAVFGAIRSGELITFSVADVHQAAGYQAQLIDIADDQNTLRPTKDAYGLSVIR